MSRWICPSCKSGSILSAADEKYLAERGLIPPPCANVECTARNMERKKATKKVLTRRTRKRKT